MTQEPEKAMSFETWWSNCGNTELLEKLGVDLACKEAYQVGRASIEAELAGAKDSASIWKARFDYVHNLVSPETDSTVSEVQQRIETILAENAFYKKHQPMTNLLKAMAEPPTPEELKYWYDKHASLEAELEALRLDSGRMRYAIESVLSRLESEKMLWGEIDTLRESLTPAEAKENAHE